MSKHVCVVGAGLAGGVLASTLAARGYRVTLVEQGNRPAPSVPSDETWEGADLKSVFTRGEGIGGSSNFWHSGLIVLDRTDIEGRSELGTGARFPMTYAQLCEYYRQALHLITNSDVTLEDLLPDEVPDENFPLDHETFRLKPMIFPPRPFSTQGMIRAAVREHNLSVVTDFRVDRVVFQTPTHVEYIEGVRAGESERTRIAADHFALCAGGIGSPKILLNSTDSNPSLRELPIGRFLIDHPTGFAFKAKLRRRFRLKNLFGRSHDRVRAYRKRLGIVLRSDRLDVASERNHVLYLRPAFSLRDPEAYNQLKSRLVAHRGRRLTAGDFLHLFTHFDLLAEALNFRLGLFSSVRFVSGYVFAEQLDFAENEIARDGAGRFKVTWRIAPSDSSSLAEFLSTFVRRHDEVFERVIFFPGLLGSGAHHSGGCRMADNKSEGVVGADLRVFGMENLSVADGSVLGYSGHTNTGLTIAALGLKCADEVAARLR